MCYRARNHIYLYFIVNSILDGRKDPVQGPIQVSADKSFALVLLAEVLSPTSDYWQYPHIPVSHSAYSEI